MLSKNKIKFIKSLAIKKYRDESNCFVAEGFKLINDLMGSFVCELLVFTKEKEQAIAHFKANERILTDDAGMQKITSQTSPDGVLAVFQKPQNTVIPTNICHQELCLALDEIQNPGNFGTIIRIADWFGISHIFCSPNTADAYGPKTIQASMGALARVKIHYIDLPNFITQLKSEQEETPIYGTILGGENIYQSTLSNKGLIIMGNEGQGISSQLVKLLTHHVEIPNYPLGASNAESLNVAVATGIVCAEFRRRI